MKDFEFIIRDYDYQTEAVTAISDVFKGQPKDENIDDLANREIELSDEQLLENIRSIQEKKAIRQSEKLEKSELLGTNCRCSLGVDMETGTGKTFVYTKAIFELNKLYGWRKFIIIVPSVAIREGVKTSLDMTSGTRSYFNSKYKGKYIDSFIYRSDQLDLVQKFSSPRFHGKKCINVMIINAQAFNSDMDVNMGEKKAKELKKKGARKIFSPNEDFRNRRPIDAIAGTRPIVILDEPQRLNGTKTQKGIGQFKPLFVVNFSATHTEKHNLIYLLDALEAYKQKLVKKIQVKGFSIYNLQGNSGFMHLNQISLRDKKELSTASLTIEVDRGSRIECERFDVKEGTDLYRLSNNLAQYRGYVVTDISERGIMFSKGGTMLTPSDDIGATGEEEIRRVQIEETIRSHFEKERELFDLYGQELERGREVKIKCLSLFFIDHVENYRKYDEDGKESPGVYGEIFEQKYKKVLDEYIDKAKTDDSSKKFLNYLGIFNFDDKNKKIAAKKIEAHIHKAHNGYFSVDKTGRAIDSVEKRGEEGSDDISAYDLILKDKERLLSFDEPTRFIFSHSALREGWDNPNIFQICTLKQSGSEINKRQEVGRGMRICVSDSGERMDSIFMREMGKEVHDVNVLTVIASESYKDFATNLQKEWAKELRNRLPKATEGYFSGKLLRGHSITAEEAKKIIQYLQTYDYIDNEGNITDEYREAQEDGVFATLPKTIKHFGEENVHNLIKGMYDEKIPDISNASATKSENKVNEDNFVKFKKLWDLINNEYKCTFRLNSRKLVKAAVKHINEALNVHELSYEYTFRKQKSDSLEFEPPNDGGSPSDETKKIRPVDSKAEYDLLGEIAKRCQLKRQTVCDILEGIRPKKFAMFKLNPGVFLNDVAQLINEEKQNILKEGIIYDIVSKKPCSKEIFCTDSVDISRVVKAKNHITPFVITDSGTERTFAIDLSGRKEVSVFAKLPKGCFVIPTPAGGYTPDWAIIFNKEKVVHVYFVVETKGRSSESNLRGIEVIKTKCARQLFKKLFKKAGVRYEVVAQCRELINIAKPKYETE